MRDLFKGKQFIRIAKNWPVENTEQEVKAKEFLFDLETFRQDFEDSPHADTASVICRMASDKDIINGAMSNLECADTEAYDVLPSVRHLVMMLMASVGGERLGRVMVVRLMPDGHVLPHKDMGEYHDYYDRFHIVLASDGTHFSCGNEIVKMHEGEVWWFRNTNEHETWNTNAEPRDHIIVDIKLRGSKEC